MKKHILAAFAAILLFLLPAYAGEHLSGGWQATTDTTISEEAQAVFDKALKELDGASWEPVGLLSTQVVAGKNYCFLCRITPVVPEPEPSYAFVYIYEDLQGNAEILEVKEIEFGLSPLPEEEEDPAEKSGKKEENGISEQIALAEEKSSALLEELDSGLLPQQQMNLTSGELHRIWDDALNSIWKWLTEQLDEESMSALTEEEIQWIQEKDAAIKAEGAKWYGGSMQPYAENITAYQWTRERAYELQKQYEEKKDQTAAADVKDQAQDKAEAEASQKEAADKAQAEASQKEAADKADVEASQKEAADKTEAEASQKEAAEKAEAEASQKEAMEKREKEKQEAAQALKKFDEEIAGDYVPEGFSPYGNYTLVYDSGYPVKTRLSPAGMTFYWGSEEFLFRPKKDLPDMTKNVAHLLYNTQAPMTDPGEETFPFEEGYVLQISLDDGSYYELYKSSLDKHGRVFVRDLFESFREKWEGAF